MHLLSLPPSDRKFAPSWPGCGSGSLVPCRDHRIFKADLSAGSCDRPRAALAHLLGWKRANFDLIKTGNVIFLCPEPDTTILHAASVKGGERGLLVERDRKMVVMDDHAQAMPVVPQDVCINAHRDACPSRPRKGRGVHAVRGRSDCSRCCFGSRMMFICLQATPFVERIIDDQAVLEHLVVIGMVGR